MRRKVHLLLLLSQLVNGLVPPAPYTYVLPVSGATTSNIVEINYASNASSQAIEAYQNAMLADGGQTTNQITIKATEKPTVDIPITIVIRNDL